MCAVVDIDVLLFSHIVIAIYVQFFALVGNTIKLRCFFVSVIFVSTYYFKNCSKTISMNY